MDFTIFSVFMSIAWSSLLAVFCFVCRKKHFFIRRFGITSLLFLYFFSIIRIAIPCDFPFSKAVYINGILSRVYEIIYLEPRDKGQVSPWLIMIIIWSVVAVALIIRFIVQYVRAVREISAYSVCEDEQCRRVLRRLEREQKRQMKIVIKRSDKICTPMGIGLLRKSVILPDEGYSDEDLYYILCHEYMHFQNRDLFLKILVHIFCCIFWWNPLMYLMEKGLAQTLEMKCDLGVTDGMENEEKAKYLSAIVSTLRKADERRSGKVFYGATALVSRNYQAETIERFKLVSGDYNGKKNILLTMSWALVFVMLLTVSYSFVIHPKYEPPIGEIETEPGVYEVTAENSYLIKHADGTYTWVYEDGSEQVIREEIALPMISQGFEVLEEEIK